MNNRESQVIRQKDHLLKFTHEAQKAPLLKFTHEAQKSTGNPHYY